MLHRYQSRKNAFYKHHINAIMKLIWLISKKESSILQMIHFYSQGTLFFFRTSPLLTVFHWRKIATATEWRHNKKNVSDDGIVSWIDGYLTLESFFKKKKKYFPWNCLSDSLICEKMSRNSPKLAKNVQLNLVTRNMTQFLKVESSEMTKIPKRFVSFVLMWLL